MSATLGIVHVVGAVNGIASAFVPIVPCRLVDTRSTSQVGIRGTAIPPDGTATFAVWGSNGDCTIPSTATGIATNVTTVNPTAPSFLTVYPADAARPLTSNLNWVPSSPPTPNQVTVRLSAGGAVSVYNLAGTIDLIVDVVGYYVALPTPTPPPAPPKAYQSLQNGTAAFGTGGQSYSSPIASLQVPNGTYLVSYSATVVNFTGTGDFFRCSLRQWGGPRVALTTAFIGPGAPVSTLNGEFKTTLTGSGSYSFVVECTHDVSLPSNNMYVETASLTALEVS